jgi:hypothetical protein
MANYAEVVNFTEVTDFTEVINFTQSTNFFNSNIENYIDFYELIYFCNRHIF